jgi:hypothetical protein
MGMKEYIWARQLVVLREIAAADFVKWTLTLPMMPE